MGNGKGYLECRLCKYASPPWPSYEMRHCQYHNDDITPPKENGGHMICCHFSASELYWKENYEWMPPARRFAWFGIDLEAGYLYEFPYPNPEHAVKVKAFEGASPKNV
jgi:hypothetical protein